LTKRLLAAARKGQELVTDGPGGQAVPVVHEARNDADPKPWVWHGPGGRQNRYSASACYGRLILPLPAGTVLEHTQSRKRGLFAGPAEIPSFVLVEFDGQTMTVSRSLLRPVKS
jgi:hypothetical protein